MSSTFRLGLMTTAAAAILAALLWMIAGGGIVGAQQSAKTNPPNKQVVGNGEQKISLADLDSGCASSVGEDGYGSFNVSSRSVISNERGEIAVPCRVLLKEGASLKLNNVVLRSKHLSVYDPKPNGETRVELNNTDLIAEGRHGFLVQLADDEDSLAVHGSTVDYPLSVWARISNEDTKTPNFVGGGRIEVTNSDLRADDPKSENGIQLVAGETGGRAKFNKVRLDTGDPPSGYQNALLYAGECEARQVEGVPNRCGPEAVLDGLR